MNGLVPLVARLRPLLTPCRLQYYLAALFLPQVVLFLLLETTPGVLDRQQRVRGRDFVGYYVWGRIILHEDAHRVYDSAYFHQMQAEVLAPAAIDSRAGRPPVYPFYPPSAGLLFCTFALLPYGWAVVVWWLVLASCFAGGFALLLRSLQPLPPWQATAWMALAAFVPVSSTFWNGQLAGLLFLAAVIGMEQHGAGRHFRAGLALALLALKPPLILGIGLWLLLRRDVRALLGLAVGLLAQLALAALLLGPEFLGLYLRSLPFYLDQPWRETMTPDHQHALAGILTNLVGPAHNRVCKLVHVTVTVVCAVILFLIVRACNRPAFQHAGGPDSGVPAHQSGRLEQAAALLFTVLAAPHLNTYDMVLLLLPIVHLLSWAHQPRPSAELAVAGLLYLACSITFAYPWTGFSVVPVVIVLALVNILTSTRAEPAKVSEASTPTLCGAWRNYVFPSGYHPGHREPGADAHAPSQRPVPAVGRPGHPL